MIYIAINVIFNTMILAFAFMSVAGITKVGAHVPEWQLTAIAYAILAVLTILGYSRIGTNLVGLFQPWRKMAGREKTRLEPLFSEIIEQTNREYGTTYRLSDFKIKVTDNRMVNACALGYNTIAVNKGALNSFTDNQLQALLAHEMGHLYYRDSVRSCALIFSAFATRMIMWLYAIYAVIVAVIAEAEKGTKSGILTLVSLIPLLVFLPILIFNWIGAKVFTLLNMAMSRKAEYRADAFSASLGYKSDMISALEVLDELSAGSDNSFMGKLMSTHPATMLRIGALEDDEVARKNIGGLFVATPFATNNAAGVAGNSEVIRLSTVLLIAGILWCGMGFWDSYKYKQGVYGVIIHQLRFQLVIRQLKTVMSTSLIKLRARESILNVQTHQRIMQIALRRLKTSMAEQLILRLWVLLLQKLIIWYTLITFIRLVIALILLIILIMERPAPP